jgi:Asp-tRNA(Asn)/Glu-tRNA(Gln) amidotransferase A subunit family amidase
MDPCFATATRLARAIRNGRLSSVEATRAHLDRIARLNGPLNALVVIDCEGALKAARAADRARAKKNGGLGPLHGVPITIKEAFDVAGLGTTSSHPPIKDNVAREDASLVGRLRAAGAIILGKTNVPELCADFQTDSPLFGTSRNAWDARRTAGLDLAEFFAVLDRRDRTMHQCEGFLDDYDAWLMPVMPDAAFIRQKQSEPLMIDGAAHPYFFAGTAYNYLANLTGQPSVVLPCGFSRDGLPIGLQLTGKRWGDARLLGVAKALEKLLPACPVPPNYRD